MEKVIHSLYGANIPDAAQLAIALSQCGARHIRLNVSDDEVAPAAGLAQQRGASLPDAIVQFWLSSSNAIVRAQSDAVLDAYCERREAWLVSESTIIENEAHPANAGERTTGFAQMAFLTLPDGMAWEAWRKVWRDSHTQIAIDTQSNFEYVQNLVIEPVTESAPPFVAIVEECFPEAAMTDPAVFFDAVGDPDKFQANLDIMMTSCARFITPGTIDVVPTSQYDLT